MHRKPRKSEASVLLEALLRVAEGLGLSEQSRPLGGEVSVGSCWRAALLQTCWEKGSPRWCRRAGRRGPLDDADVLGKGDPSVMQTCWEKGAPRWWDVAGPAISITTHPGLLSLWFSAPCPPPRPAPPPPNLRVSLVTCQSGLVIVPAEISVTIAGGKGALCFLSLPPALSEHACTPVCVCVCSCM